MNQYTRKNSLRLAGYDYSRPGYYFITICAKNGEVMFGKIEDGKMHANEYGQTAEAELRQTADMWHFTLDCCTVMPNHIHFIAIKASAPSPQPVGAACGPPETLPCGSTEPRNKQLARAKAFIPAMVQAYKAAVTRTIGFSLWHRSYYDSIIKTRSALEFMRKYINNNPASWGNDKLNPRNFEEYIQKHPL